MKRHILLTFAILSYCVLIASQNFPKVIELKKDIQIREEPNINYPVKDIIRNGNYIEIIGEVDNFYEIKHVGKISYTLKSQINTGIVNPSNDIEVNRGMQPIKYNDIYGSANTDPLDSYSVSTQTYSSNNTTSRSSSSYKSSYSNLCGARTKKGGSCQRRVSGGGRCWQH